MKATLLKIAGFFLGQKDSPYKELAARGKKMRVELINREIEKNSTIKIADVKEIFFIGAIEKSKHEVLKVKESIQNNIGYNFTTPHFDPDKDYIEFYQIVTNSNRYYIHAIADWHDLTKIESTLFLLEIIDKIPTDNLPADDRYK